MRDPLTTVSVIVGVLLLVAMIVLLPIALLNRRRSDYDSIRREADQRGCRVKSIRYAWFALFRGPFAGEPMAKRTRVYRVDCREEKRKRVAYVVIGPRRNYESDEQLTWRWADNSSER